MFSRPTGHGLLATSVLCAVFGGCQQLSSPLTLVNPFSKTPSADKDLSLTQQDPSGSLRPEQKADVKIVLARGLEQQGKIDEAKKVYLEITKQDPRRADAYHSLALLHDRKGDCQAAQNFYRQALERDPNNPELHCDRGYSVYLQQRWEDAEASLRRAIALAPDLARAHNNLGMLLARTGREDDALQEFGKAGASAAGAHANLALAMTLSNRWNEAQTQYQLALTRDPNLKVAQQGLQTLQALAAKPSATTGANDAQPAEWPVAQASYRGS